uniref:Uncharacterized protein n=1 Tax=Romanomermis culicivorax TaxID=13658 RepID=A0A915K7K3_ROMCU
MKKQMCGPVEPTYLDNSLSIRVPFLEGLGLRDGGAAQGGRIAPVPLSVFKTTHGVRTTLFLLAIIVSQSYKSLLNCHDPNVAAFEQSRTWWGLACHHIMLAVYPIIVFELSFSVEWFHFKKRFVEVALFGFPSFILSCFVFATGTFVVLLLWKIECTYPVSVFYSSIVMSIDPCRFIFSTVLRSLLLPLFLLR